MRFIFVLFLTLSAFCQTDLYLPWVPQNATFNTKIIINNYNGETVEVTLEAVRTSTMTETETLTIEPFSSLQSSAGELFSDLGEGAGYVVSILSDAANITAACVVFATTTTSGESPSQMNAIPRSQASQAISFNFLPVTEDGFSAPVVANLGESAALVRFHAFRNGLELDSFLRNLLPGEVFARQTSELFPDVTGDLYVIAESDQPLVGAAFIFNGSREPAMAPAVPVDVVPDPLGTLSGLRIRPSFQRIDLNQTLNIVADGLYFQGPFQDLTRVVNWSSSDPTVASVSNISLTRGLVTAKKAGETMIKIEYEGLTDTARIEVLGPRLKLEEGACQTSINDCTWFDTVLPNFSEYSATRVGGAEVYGIRYFRFTAVNADYKILSTKAIDRRGLVTPFIAGIIRDLNILDGQETTFILVSESTNGQEADLLFEVEVEGLGVVLRHEVLFTGE